MRYSYRTVFQTLALAFLSLMLFGTTAQAQQPVPGTEESADVADAPPAKDAPSAKALDDIFLSESGFISTSIDGVGSNSSSAVVEVEKPSNATVLSAHLLSASLPGDALSTVTLSHGSNSLVIDPADYDAVVANSLFDNTENGREDVTSFVKSIVDTASAGRIEFSVSEENTSTMDGVVLAVVFDDPNVDQARSTVFIFGGQDPDGDSFGLNLADPFDAETQELEMSLGISYGFQPSSQYSTVEVNNTLLSSSAGGQDDCHDYSPSNSCGNGELLTVGGLGDEAANPPDTTVTSPDSATYDDELYKLGPAVSDGATSVQVRTENPSNDDNIFFAGFIIKGTSATVNEGITLGPTQDSVEVGSTHTVTARVSDSSGNPISGRAVDFEVLGGPNAGLTGSDTTGTNGEATFTLSSSTAGTDTIRAESVDSAGDPITSNKAIVTWTQGFPEEVAVWPGDTDNDGVVDQADVLPLGMHWDQNGPSRSSITCSWQGWTVSTWATASATFADANGDGTVDQADVLCLGLNWGRTHATSSSSLLAAKSGSKASAGRLEVRHTGQSGSATWIELHAEGVENLLGVATELAFESENVSILEVEAGPRMGGESALLQSNFDEQKNRLGIGISRPGASAKSKAASEEAPLARVKVKTGGGDPPQVRATEGVASTETGQTLKFASLDSEFNRPKEIALKAPAPNPVRKQATLRYALPEKQRVRLAVYDMLGREVAVLVDGQKAAGQQTATLNASSLAPGTYFYRLEADETVITKRLTIVR